MTTKNSFTKRVEKIIYHPNFVKYMDVCTSIVDVGFKLGSAGKNPFLLIPAAGSVFGTFVRGLTGADGVVAKTINSLDLASLSSSLGQILISSDLLKHFNPVRIAKDEDFVLHSLEVEPGLTAYLHKCNGNNFETCIYGRVEDKEVILKSIINRCFRLIGGGGVEIASSDRNGGMAMRPLSSGFTDHPIEKVLDLSNAIHQAHKDGDSIAYIFYGPPGTGKSTMALSVAELMNMKVLMLGPQAIEKLFGKTFIDMIEGLRPGMIILDDIDKANARNLFYTTLNQIRVTFPNIVVIATTNDPEKLGNAFLRPGRGGELMAFDPPTLEEKKVILVKSGAKFTDEIAEKINEKATHDWVTFIARKVQRAKTPQEALRIVSDINNKFEITEGIKSPARPSYPDYYDDEETL